VIAARHTIRVIVIAVFPLIAALSFTSAIAFVHRDKLIPVRFAEVVLVPLPQAELVHRRSVTLDALLACRASESHSATRPTGDAVSTKSCSSQRSNQAVTVPAIRGDRERCERVAQDSDASEETGCG
jgi:hypothetical protein